MMKHKLDWTTWSFAPSNIIAITVLHLYDNIFI